MEIRMERALGREFMVLIVEEDIVAQMVRRLVRIQKDDEGGKRFWMDRIIIERDEQNGNLDSTDLQCWLADSISYELVDYEEAIGEEIEIDDLFFDYLAQELVAIALDKEII